MSDYFHQLDSRFAGESFFALLCARQLEFAVVARRRAMRLRSTSSQARRFAAGVSHSAEALAYVQAFAATCGFRRSLRATNLPARVGAQPGVLRAMRAHGCRSAARLQTRRGRRWFVESLAATRGDLSRSLRAGLGSLAHAASSSTKCSEPRFRNGRVSCGAPCSLITLQRHAKENKRLTRALQLTAPAVTVAANSRSGVSRAGHLFL